MESSQNQNNVYFAAKSPEDCANIALNKADSFFNTLRANAYLEKVSNMWKFYHGSFMEAMGYGHRIDFTGEQGELTVLPINHFRNIAQHLLNMITSNRPIMEAKAVNTDYKSLSQTYVANGILDYYMRQRNLEMVIKKATEMAIVLGTGYIKMDWNSTAGEKYDTDPDTGVPVYEGEIEFSNLSPFDVVFDGTKEGWNNDWLLVRSFQNRFNLMAKYPEMASKIAGQTPKSMSSVYRLAVFSNDDTDDIPVYEFYHKRTEALPNGRYMLFVASDVILLDSDLPYREIPIYRIVPSEIMGTPYGYAPMFDIFPIQEGINALYSTIMTNQNTFGVQNIFIPRGADIQVSNLEGGLNVIEANAEPKPLNLTQTPAEVFKFVEMLIQAAETISGVNSVARGNPEASLKSGAALALVQSMALQFISGLQQSYVKLIEETGTGIINILKDFSTTPKIIAIVGKNNRTELKEFIGEDVAAINRVIVDVGNPLSRTIAGRVQMAEQLLQMKLLKNPEQYFQVINTGKLESMYEGEMSELLNIKKENERMMSLKSVFALAIDSHQLHIVEHKAVLDDPDLRENQEIVQIVTDHILEHIKLLRNTDPDLLQLLGQQPLQPPAPQGNPQMGLPPGPPQQSLQNSPMNGMMQNQQQEQIDSVQSPLAGTQSLPSMPNPPSPFESLPTNPAEMGSV